MISISKISNEQRKNHLEEIKAELEDNDNKIYDLTRKSSELLIEVEELRGK